MEFEFNDSNPCSHQCFPFLFPAIFSSLSFLLFPNSIPWFLNFDFNKVGEDLTPFVVVILCVCFEWKIWGHRFPDGEQRGSSRRSWLGMVRSEKGVLVFVIFLETHYHFYLFF